MVPTGTVLTAERTHRKEAPMTSNTNLTNCTGASGQYAAFADFDWTDANVGIDHAGAGMAKRQVTVIGHPSTTRRPQEVLL